MTLLGRDGTEEITMEELADLSGRFHYEIPCLMGKRLPRSMCPGDGPGRPGSFNKHSGPRGKRPLNAGPVSGSGIILRQFCIR